MTQFCKMFQNYDKNTERLMYYNHILVRGLTISGDDKSEGMMGFASIRMVYIPAEVNLPRASL